MNISPMVAPQAQQQPDLTQQQKLAQALMQQPTQMDPTGVYSPLQGANTLARSAMYAKAMKPPAPGLRVNSDLSQISPMSLNGVPTRGGQ